MKILYMGASSLTAALLLATLTMICSYGETRTSPPLSYAMSEIFRAIAASQNRASSNLSVGPQPLAATFSESPWAMHELQRSTQANQRLAYTLQRQSSRGDWAGTETGHQGGVQVAHRPYAMADR
jgi:hypothetical protein